MSPAANGMPDRGAVHSEQAYALGKMLDHSAWQHGEKIVRLITPSDIDAAWDNDGKIIFGEFSRSASTWDKIRNGQRWLYESCVRNGPHCAAICKHDVRPEENRKIDSKNDVVSFQLMFYDHCFVVSKLYIGNDLWRDFVSRWFQDSLQVRRYVLSRCEPLTVPK